MKKRVISLGVVFAMSFASAAAWAADNTLKMMDTNSDGLISKTEYMKHHERMWAVFKKNKDGQVTLDDMKRAPGAAKSDADPKKDAKAAR